MELDQLRKLLFDGVKMQYETNDNPDFDITPVVFGISEEGGIVVGMLAGPPHQLLPNFIVQAKLVAYAFASASWITNAETHERKEGIIFSLETPTHSEMWTAEVKRDPLPSYGELIKAEQFDGRLAHLLHQHQRN